MRAFLSPLGRPRFRGVHGILCVALVALGACGRGATPAPRPAQPAADSGALLAHVRRLLDAYGRKDLAALEALLDAGSVAMFGTDSAEATVGRPAVVRQVREDYALWDSLRAGEPRNVHVALGADLAGVLFDVPTRVYRGGREARYLVRFATTWRRRGPGWRLVQSLNSVPTSGQSAAELARPRDARDADRAAQVRAAIQARYARQADAYARRDAATFIENLEPDFVAEPLRGPRVDRAGTVAAVRSRMARVEDPRIAVTIDSLRVAGDTAEVYSEQHFTRTVRDSSGAPRVVVSRQRHLERWRRTPRGWRIFYLRELGGAEALVGEPRRAP